MKVTHREGAGITLRLMNDLLPLLPPGTKIYTNLQPHELAQLRLEYPNANLHHIPSKLPHRRKRHARDFF